MSTVIDPMSGCRKPRSVVFIAKNTHLGGAELSLLALMDRLKDAGLQLHLLTGEAGTLHPQFQRLCASLMRVRLPYPRKFSSWLHLPHFSWQLLKLKKQINSPVDCVANDFYETFAALLAARILGASRALGFWQSSYTFDSEEDSQKWTKYGGDNLDFRLASGPVASHLNAVRKSKHPVVPFNPLVDEIRFCATRYNRAEIRSNLKWQHTHHGIVVGRIGDSKGQIDLAKAFLAVKVANGSQLKNLRLCIVGPAGPEDKHALEILQRQSEGCVEYLGERSDIPELLAASDLALFPGSIPESFGLAIQEAVFMGIPVLAVKNKGAVSMHFANSPNVLCDSLPEMIHKWASLASKEDTHAPPGADRQAAVERYGFAAYSRQVLEVFLQVENKPSR